MVGPQSVGVAGRQLGGGLDFRVCGGQDGQRADHAVEVDEVRLSASISSRSSC